MDLAILADTPPWEWPEDARETLLASLRDRTADPATRVTAAELASETVVMDDDLAEQMLTVLRDTTEPADLRARVAISLGPVIEETDMEGFDTDGISDPPIAESTFDDIRETLRRLHIDEQEPKEVRRRILEASVRSPQDWHRDAVRAAWSTDDHDWKMTAVFCMGYVPGFESQILTALENGDAELEFEAVRAAGARDVDAAWPHIAALIQAPKTDRDLLLAAIEAAGSIRPEEAGKLVVDLVDSDDEAIAEAAGDVIMLAETDLDEIEEDDEDDEEDEEEKD